MFQHFVLSLLIVSFFGCERPRALSQARDTSRDATESSKQVADRLVQQLASKERIVDAPSNSPWSGDTDVREKYCAAVGELQNMGISAIPSLIDGLLDERYSCSRSYSVVYDYTVADECQRIIDDIVTPDIETKISAIPQARFKRVKSHPTVSYTHLTLPTKA